jgi:putative membrane protein
MRIDLVVKGLFMGTADVIPGVSGGTVALILGIYEELVDAIKSVNMRFLIPLGVGIGGALILFARVIPYLMGRYPSETSALFLGLILSSATIPYGRMEKKRGVEVLFGTVGFALAFFVVGLTHLHTSPSIPFIFLCGFVAICAMVLPGVSGAFMLVLLGQYATMLEAVRDMNLHLIIPFALGALVGITSFVRLLSFLLHRYHSCAMAGLTGLMLGSLRAVLPQELKVSVIPSFLFGVGLFLFLRYMERGGKWTIKG